MELRDEYTDLRQLNKPYTDMLHVQIQPWQSSSPPMRLLVLAAFACAYLAAPARLLGRIRCRWALLPCSNQWRRRRASFWPDCSKELQHDARAPRKSSSPPMRLFVLAAIACAHLAAPATLLDRIRCRWPLLPCSSQRWRRRASFSLDCSTELQRNARVPPAAAELFTVHEAACACHLCVRLPGCTIVATG